MYLMMGRDFELMEEMPSGNIFAIGGLENLVLKSGTLSSTVFSPSFSDMFFQTTPIVRVAIEPKHPGNLLNSNVFIDTHLSKSFMNFQPT
jgi:ribosome assembly protein 1